MLHPSIRVLEDGRHLAQVNRQTDEDGTLPTGAYDARVILEGSGTVPCSISLERLLPPGIRFRDESNLIIEQQPQRRVIEWIAESKEVAYMTEERETYEIMFPWTVFHTSSRYMGQMKMFFARRPIQNLDNTLYGAVLPNIMAHDSVVCESFKNHTRDIFQNMLTRANRVFEDGFNDNAGTLVPSYVEDEYGFEEWSALFGYLENSSYEQVMDVLCRGQSYAVRDVLTPPVRERAPMEAWRSLEAV